MKKVLASVLALTMTAVMFTSCGDSDSSSKSESKAASSSKAAETTTTTTAEETTTTPAETEAPSESEADTSEAEGPAEFDITKVNGYDENATETVFEFKDEVSDAWAKRLTEGWVSLVKAQPMPEGRQLIPGWFSWARTIEYGSKVGATPNGRRAGEPVSHGANPNPHFRTDGAPTAQSNGIAAVQCGYGNTAPLQLEFDPKLSNDEKGIDMVLALIEGHFRQGGTLININILDADKLKAANDDPDLYPDLVVRVTGFTAYFASLSPQFRQLVVNRFLEGI